MAFLPIGYLVFIFKNKAKLSNLILEKRFGSLWEDLRIQEYWALAYYPLFMIRRGAFVAIVVCFKDQA